MAKTNEQIEVTLIPVLDVVTLTKQVNAMLNQMKQNFGAFGKGIKLIDSANLEKEMSGIVDKARQAAGGFKAVASEADILATKVKSVGTSATALGKAFSFNQMATSISLVTNSMSAFLDPFIELDKQIKNIGTLGVENVEEFGGLISDLAIKIPDSAVQIAEGVYQAISAGTTGTKQEIIDFVEVASKAAVAGMSDTGTAVDGLTSVLNAYKMESSQAGEVASTFFAGVKLGKTTFGELTGSLATFVPLAAATGVGFDEMVGAISQMTALGTPTSLAATQIRAAMVLIQKGGPGLNKALKQQGLSLKDFQKQLAAPVEAGGGLVNTLQSIRDVVDKAGMTLPEATGRIEAAGAIMNLTGDNLKRTQEIFKGVQQEIANDAANKAFEVAAGSISANTESIMASVQAQFNNLFTAIGTGGATALSSLTRLSPAIIGFTALGQALPIAGMKNLATNIITKVIPSLAAGTTGTVTMTAATKALGKAMVTTPWGIAITLILAVVAAYALLHKSATERAKEAVDEAKKEEEIVEKRLELNQANQTLAKSNINLVDKLKTMKAANDEVNKTMVGSGKSIENTKEYKDTILQLARSYPGVVKESASYEENIKAITKAQGELTEEQKEQVKVNNELIDEYEELGNKTEKTASEQERYDEILVQLNKAYPGVIGQTGSFTTELAALRIESSMTTGELINLRAEFNKLSTERQAASFKTLKKEADEARVGINSALKEISSYLGAGRFKDALSPFIQEMFKIKDPAILKEMGDSLINTIKLGGDAVDFSKWDFFDKLGKTQQNLMKGAFRTLGSKTTKEQNILNDSIAKFTGGLGKVLATRQTGELGATEKFLAGFKTRLAKAIDKDDLTDVEFDFSQSLKASFAGKKFTETRETLTKQFKALFASAMSRIEGGGAVPIPSSKAPVKAAKSLEEDVIAARLNARKTASALIIAQMEDGAAKEKTVRAGQFRDEIAAFDKKERDILKELKTAKGKQAEDLHLLLLIQDQERLKAEDKFNIELENIDIKHLDKELAELEKGNKKKIEQSTKFFDAEKLLLENQLQVFINHWEIRNNVIAIMLGEADKILTESEEERFNGRMTTLEEQLDSELITQAEYKQKKREEEEDHQNQILVIQSMAKGAELGNARAAEEEMLQAELDAKEAERQLVLSSEELTAEQRKEQVAALDVEIEELAAAVKDKGDLLLAYSEEIQGGVTKIFSNIFTGDIEDMKDPLREILGTLGGALKATASATVTKLILEQLALTPGGLAALIAIPAITAVVNAGVNAILDPILSRLLSFGTGGRVDSPTLALIGDAKTQGAFSDREWVLRDDQMLMIIKSALEDSKLLGLDSDMLSANSTAMLIPAITNLNRSIQLLTNAMSNLTDAQIQSFYNGETSVHPENMRDMTKIEFMNVVKQQKLGIKSYAGGSGFINQPELALLGDSPFNPEIVLNSPQLQGVIQGASGAGSKEMMQKMDQLIAAVHGISIQVGNETIKNSYDEAQAEQAQGERTR